MRNCEQALAYRSETANAAAPLAASIGTRRRLCPLSTLRTSAAIVSSVLAALVVSLAVGLHIAPSAVAEPTSCDNPFCVPGITPNVVLGAPCGDTTHYVFGTTSWGRLVFCGSPRRYAPRYFRSPSMAGVKDENSSCTGHENNVAQAPDGLFLSCVSANGQSLWVRGDT
jgi:hypothetical protein